jgi:hypothetical protein
MTYLFSPQVDFINQNMDAAARLRTSTPLTVFEHSNQYGTNPFKFDTLTSGTGTITEPSGITATGTVLSTGGTASGAQAVRASRNYLHYATGKSLFVGMSFQFGTGATGCSQRAGYYDANNGVFIQQIATAVSLVFRSNTSGSPVDNTVAQTSWNVDQFNGSGPSGQTLSSTAVQNVRMDFIGNNSIRCYLYANGRYWLIHVMENANMGSPTTPSPTIANLTVRTEVVNTATAGATVTMTVFNQSALHEGAEDPYYSATFAAGNGATTITPSGARPICSIRASTTGPRGTIRNFGQIIPQGFTLYTAGTVLAQIVYNATLTGASWSSVSTQSLAQFDVAATASTGGIIIYSEYVVASSSGFLASSGAGLTDLSLQFPLVYSSLLNTQDTLSLVVTPIGTGAATAGNFNWAEIW